MKTDVFQRLIEREERVLEKVIQGAVEQLRSLEWPDACRENIDVIQDTIGMCSFLE